VGVDDKERVWSSGVRPGDGHNGIRPNRRSPDQSFGSGGRGRVGGRGGDRGGRGGGRGGGGRGRGPNFGPLGHDYSPSSLASAPLPTAPPIPQIHAAIALRLQAKLSRNFDEADKIQLKLVERGVYLNDRTKEWRADGVCFIDPSEGRRAVGDRDRPYVMSQHSLPFEPTGTTVEPPNEDDGGGSSVSIAELVAQRAEHKRSQRFTEADSIRQTLLQTYDITIDDRIREWSVGGSFGPVADLKRAHSTVVVNRSYTQSTSSMELPPGVDEGEIQQKVDERMVARVEGRYSVADAMRSSIEEEYGVIIHDTIRMWSVGGSFGRDDPVKFKADAKRTYTEYKRRGGGDLSEEELVQIGENIEKRFQAKLKRNFEVADEIRSMLHGTYNIFIDDKNREWQVLCDDYVQIDVDVGEEQRKLTVEEVEMVTARLLERATFKREKQYAEADAIRDQLQDVFSIIVDDRTKEWKVTSGSVGGNSRFEQEAANSQLSPFKLKQMERELEMQRIDKKMNEGFERKELMDQGLDEQFDSIFKKVSSREALVGADIPDLADVPQEKDNSLSLAAEAEVVSSSASSLSASSREDLMALTVPVLKEKLRESGKPVSGRKAELIERLLLA